MEVDRVPKRRNCIPVLHTRGTYYEVGYDIGSTFKNLIQDYVNNLKPLNDKFIPLFNTEEGRHVYESTLTAVKTNYPQYIEEIQGTADGAEVPFFKLFLIHLDEILPNVLNQKEKSSTYGCSTICLNKENQVYLGHTEDVPVDVFGHIYIVCADIKSESPRGRWQIREERFTSLCYAGCLPGFAMSYNYHGMISTMNIIRANKLRAPKTPRTFICRALLAARSIKEVENILTDDGWGVADGFSINTIFLKDNQPFYTFYNIEVGPPQDDQQNASILDIATAKFGECMYHCNTYVRIKMKEAGINKSSEKRWEILNKTSPSCKLDILKLLGDQSDKEYAIFRDPKWQLENNSSDYGATVVVGLFDCIRLSWSIYSDNPLFNEPLLTIPLHIEK